MVSTERYLDLLQVPGILEDPLVGTIIRVLLIEAIPRYARREYDEFPQYYPPAVRIRQPEIAAGTVRIHAAPSADVDLL